MLLASIGLTILFQAAPTPAVPVDAYADQGTAALVARLRAARDRNERLVTAYTATAKQRIGVGVRALSRDRMLYRSEVVVRIAWQRDTSSTVEVVGAREGIPIAIRGDRVPEDMRSMARDLVLNPAEDYLRLIGGDDDGLIYPLRQGAEADYRYATGDTTTITLPTGKVVRLIALQVTPRRADWQLVNGTFWYDLDTEGLVRAAFRPARPFEFKRDISAEDREGTPGWVNPGGEIRFITMEYGLYENRWWMPRYVAMDASGTWGSWLNVPFRFERIYEDYEVEGGTPPPEGSTFRPAGTIRRRVADDSVTDASRRTEVSDSLVGAIRACVAEARALPRDTDEQREARRFAIESCSSGASDQSLAVILPDDTLSVLSSPELGEPILAMGDLITEDEIRGLSESIRQLPAAPWDPRLRMPDGIAGELLRNARFNRIEALSLGTRAGVDFGPMALEGSARIGMADLVPNAELGLVRTAPTVRFRLAGYYRLAAANPEVRPFGAVNSVFGLLAMRDDGEYFRTLGVEGVIENPNAGWWKLQVWHQRERPVTVETSAGLPHLFNGDRQFRPNITADSATQTGAALSFRGTRTLSHTVAIGGELRLEGQTGDFEFGRGHAAMRFFLTPPGPLAGAVSFTAGTSRGTLPVQSLYYVGGSPTLRGYDGGVLAGTAFWAGRAELANSFPAARVSVFSDLGWAGGRQDFWSGRPLWSAGIGASFLDGLIRVDLARGLRNPKGFRLELYFDGIL